MLTIPIKKAKFERIIAGTQREEYRRIKPYWTARLENAFRMTVLEYPGEFRIVPWAVYKRDEPFRGTAEIRLKSAYRHKSHTARIRCSLRIGEGRPEWGAEKGENYYILEIQEIMEETE